MTWTDALQYGGPILVAISAYMLGGRSKGHRQDLSAVEKSSSLVLELNSRISDMQVQMGNMQSEIARLTAALHSVELILAERTSALEDVRSERNRLIKRVAMLEKKVDHY
jgi:chromosome segregation ATPase